ncbi:SDR family NAD(P)-dependent oxidoreductase [Nocardioides marmoriginsengisoli]|uniref:SDR family NAD(P)-dependent oxidoreductase n=1 Tax=Nocardioides marmoriginsengisoli TaxID=661483 RepID=A0A3N0CDJ0_9ACTN|nr:SDR family NAD(P)-dependent oxidoreductase [Nocardioides marmoriginsengisoli]RNL61301.1 SDR family NAD(P)-dependent oxidoreductase [Nocardioides marmoriginsengisoli]
MNEYSVAGRVAVVTGGARGLGKSIATALAAAGADVAVWDGPDWSDAPLAYSLASKAELDETVAELGGLGVRAVGESVDVRDLDQVVQATAATVAQLGRIDILVCAAGVRSCVPASAMTDDQWNSVVETNLHGTYHAIKSALPHLTASGAGRIVVVAAEEGRRGAASLSHYSAAAWAQIGLVKSIAVESAEAGIAASVVCPGPMDTAMSRTEEFWALAQAGRDGVVPVTVPNQADAEHALRVRHPSNTTYAAVDAVRDAVLFLAGQPGLDLTGAVLDVSAGLASMNTA